MEDNNSPPGLLDEAKHFGVLVPSALAALIAARRAEMTTPIRKATASDVIREALARYFEEDKP